jgi:hypothetical protein
MLRLTTHFEQVSLEIVARILGEQASAETATEAEPVMREGKSETGLLAPSTVKSAREAKPIMQSTRSRRLRAHTAPDERFNNELHR